MFRDIEEDDDYMEGVEEGGDPPDHVVPAVDQSSDEESDENTDMLVAKVEKPGETEITLFSFSVKRLTDNREKLEDTLFLNAQLRPGINSRTNYNFSRT